MRGVCVCVHVPMQPNRISEDLGVIEPKSILWSLRTEQYRVLLSLGGLNRSWESDRVRRCSLTSAATNPAANCTWIQ